MGAEEATRAANARVEQGKRGLMARIAHETIEIIRTGGYRAPDTQEWVDISSLTHAAVTASVYYASKDWHPAGLPQPAFGKTVFEVRCCTTLAAAQDLTTARADGSTLALLNFA